MIQAKTKYINHNQENAKRENELILTNIIEIIGRCNFNPSTHDS
jgi:hypothetical protein